MEGPVNTEYGNFDITDESGSVYVYGLTSTIILGGSNDKSFSTLGYEEGDTLTIVGTRGDYNGKPEVMGPAYAIRAKGGAPAPEPDPEPELTKATVAEVIAAEVSDDRNHHRCSEYRVRKHCDRGRNRLNSGIWPYQGVERRHQRQVLL